ncbi:hypothetical protein BDR22DRAFT_834686 [Usnea florida]
MLLYSARRDHILCLSLLVSTVFAQGQITLFLDVSCAEESPVNPTVSLPLDTCLVTSGAYGLVPQRLPACPAGNGSATLQLYQDQSCAVPEISSISVDDNCYNLGTSGIPAVMFICGSLADGNSNATSTTTLTAASALVPVAQATQATNTPTSSGLSSQTATNVNEPIASPATPSSTADPSQANADSSGGDSESGLSQYDQIIIGIIIPVAALMVALLAWLCPKPGNGRRGEGRQAAHRMLDYPVVHYMPCWHRG